MSDNLALKTMQSLVGKINVKSSINPLLWMCGVISFPSLILFTYSGSLFVQIVLIIILILPILAVLIAYRYFMFKEPDYLRSEEYQLQRHAMDLGDQTKRVVEIINPAEENNPSMANPSSAKIIDINKLEKNNE